LCGSHRKKASLSFPAGNTNPFVRHCGLQPRLPILPELGYQQSE